jgi:predicted SnoaL-like aldol condensation-catalyzing enzyme
LIGLAALGAVYAGTRPEDMTREQKNKLLVKVAIGAMNDGDWELMAELYSPRFVQYGPGDIKPIKWADFELGCRIMKNKFPALRLAIEDIIAEGDKVAVRLKTVVTFKESHKYKTRRLGKVEMTEIDIMRIEGGRIVEEWCESDTADWNEKLRMLKYIKPWK